MSQTSMNLPFKKQNQARQAENGNIFFMLFAAVALIGVLTVSTSNVVKGLVTSMSDVTRKTVAEEKMTSGARLSIVSATSIQTNGGDCDGDGFVEPLPYRDAGTLSHPAGGGFLPADIGASLTDPWGQPYGYCVWDMGSITVLNNNAGCGGSTAKRLDGAVNPSLSAVAIISAGKNRKFNTKCNAYVDANNDGTPDVPQIERAAGGDDIVMEYTYNDANGLSGDDLWKIKDTEPETASIDKNIEVSGSGQFSGALNLMQQGLILPSDPGDDSVTGPCSEETDQQLRLNIATSPYSLEICDYTGGNGWGPIQMGETDTTIPSGAVGWWKFDETAGASVASDSLNHYPGSLGPGMNPNTAWVSGHKGNALSFDGVDDYVTMGSDTALDNMQNITVCAWFKEDTQTIANSAIVAKSNSTRYGGFNMYVNQPAGTSMSFGFIGSDDAVFQKTLTQATGPWKHLCASYNNSHSYSDIKLYLNGKVQSGPDATANGNTIDDASTNLVVGALSAASGSGSFHGLIDDVVLYNRVLSLDEVRQVYTATGGTLASSGNTPGLGRPFDALNCKYAPSNMISKSSATGTDYDEALWSDGTYVYGAGNASGLHVYYGVRDNTLTRIASGGTGGRSVWGDGSYIYTTTNAPTTINAHTFDGTTVTTVASINAQSSASIFNITGDKKYIYLAQGTAGVSAYKFDGTSFLYVTTYDTPGTAKNVWSDGKYVYVSDNDGGFHILLLKGTSFSLIATVPAPSSSNYIEGSWGDGRYIYLLGTNTLYAYRFDGTNLTLLTSLATPGPSKAIKGDGYNLYVSTVEKGFDAYRFDGKSLYLRASYQVDGLASGGYYNMWLDGTYLYLNANTLPTLALSGFSCNVSGRPSAALAYAANRYRGKISAVQSNACMINHDGIAACWGSNVYGQLGNGDSSVIERYSPIPLSSPGKWVQISTGNEASCGIKDDGTAWCWGADTQGKLGNGTVLTANQISPSAVNSTDKWTSISVGGHVCGIKTDGSAWCWGQNTYGQLGNGNTSANESPVQVSGSSGWVDISSGDNTTCGIKADGTAWCWGQNTYGQLGNGEITNSSVPVQILEPGPWAQVSAGGKNNCGIKLNGSAWCWGSQSYGSLGNGVLTGQTLVPVPVADPGPWIEIAASQIGEFTCGIKTDGSAWCWGSDSQGQLGNGTISKDLASPYRVSDPGPWASIDIGYLHACGMKTDGSAWCWGSDSAGQLGNGTLVAANQTVPSRVEPLAPSMTAWAYNEGRTVITATAGSIYMGTSNSISYDGTANNGLIFGSAGYTSLRQDGWGSQLLLETKSPSASSQITIKSGNVLGSPWSLGVDYTTGSFEIGRNNSTASNWMESISPLLEITAGGYIGIGTSGTAYSTLDITKAGGLKIGNDTSICTVFKKGALRYTGSTATPFEYCDGDNWVSF